MGVYQRNGHWWYRKRVKGRLLQWSLAKYGVTTEAQARAYEREMTKAKLADHLARLDPSRATLASLTKQFLEERAPFLAASSLDRYRVSLQALARDLGDGCLLRNITERKLGQWSASRLARGVSPAGVNADLRHIKAALGRAARWGLIEHGPEVEMVRVAAALPRHLEPDQVRAILSAETRPDRRRFWEFLLWTGCRRSEALDLRWEHVSWDEHPSARVTGKGDKTRMVPLLPGAVAALAGLSELPSGPCCAWPRQDLGWAFTFEPWGRVGANVVSKYFLCVAREAGVDARLHDLRHTCFTFLASHGVPLRMIQALAGHSTIRITEHYAKGLVTDLYVEMSAVADEMTKVLRVKNNGVK